MAIVLLVIVHCINVHSRAGQAIVGALLGVILHYYSTRLPQFVIFIDAIVESVAAFVLLMIDRTPSSRDDPSKQVYTSTFTLHSQFGFLVFLGTGF